MSERLLAAAMVPWWIATATTAVTVSVVMHVPAALVRAGLSVAGAKLHR